MIQECCCACLSSLPIEEKEKNKAFKVMPRPKSSDCQDSDGLTLEEREIRVETCNPKMRMALRALGFVTFPFSVIGLVAFAGLMVPCQLAAQREEMEKLSCPECRLQPLNHPQTPDPENPFLKAPQRTLKLIPELFNFVFCLDKIKNISGKKKKEIV